MQCNTCPHMHIHMATTNINIHIHILMRSYPTYGTVRTSWSVVMSLHFTISGLCPISASLSLFHSITVTTTTSLRCGVRNGADNKRYVLRTYTISGLFVFYVIAFISLDLHRHEAHKIRKKHTYMTPRDGKMRQQYVRLRYLGNS
jgi:hypothetical protein